MGRNDNRYLKLGSLAVVCAHAGHSSTAVWAVPTIGMWKRSPD